MRSARLKSCPDAELLCFLRPSGRSRVRGLSRGAHYFLGFAIHFLASLANIDATFEVSAILDADALSHDVARERAIRSDIHTIAGRHVTAYLPKHNDLTRRDVRRNHAVAADGYTIA